MTPRSKPRPGVGGDWTAVLVACRGLVEDYRRQHRRLPHAQQLLDAAATSGIPKGQAKRAWRVIKKEYN